jgi:8-oxo-dGTP pyrophosphatase MutT (NUDIX family)
MSLQANTDSPLHSLLRYFAQGTRTALTPIAHTDPQINRLMRSSAFPEGSLRAAAVLIPIVHHEGRYAVVLTQRTEQLSSHPGQVSFPGGRCDAEDASLIHTALRESEEEIGLPPSAVTVLGTLGNLLMPSGYCVTPIVGLIADDTPLSPSPREVAHIFRVPLQLALNVGSFERVRVSTAQGERELLQMHYDGYRIWGATATILYHLAQEIAGA